MADNQNQNDGLTSLLSSVDFAKFVGRHEQYDLYYQAFCHLIPILDLTSMNITKIPVDTITFDNFSTIFCGTTPYFPVQDAVLTRDKITVEFTVDQPRSTGYDSIEIFRIADYKVMIEYIQFCCQRSGIYGSQRYEQTWSETLEPALVMYFDNHKTYNSYQPMYDIIIKTINRRLIDADKIIQMLTKAENYDALSSLQHDIIRFEDNDRFNI